MVFSSSAIMAKERFGDPNYFSFKQIISGTFGLAIMFIVLGLNLLGDWLRDYLDPQGRK